ncbi:MAG: hypothetical protein IPN53_00715 [Comamonadaceae bacterium]|nr:hypothetical protein [Comamonadaceae bacterium]
MAKIAKPLDRALRFALDRLIQHLKKLGGFKPQDIDDFRQLDMGIVAFKALSAT